MLKPPDFFRSTKPIRPRSKIGRHKVPGVCLGFCQSVSVPRVAEKSGLSLKATRELYRSLRGLLIDPRYRKWHSLDAMPIYEFQSLDTVEAEIWRRFADCYRDDECFRNYRYGKRAERQCRNCPARHSELLRQVLTPELNQAMLRHVDNVRAYYQVLIGISRDKDLDPKDSFKLRVYHTTILLNALTASSYLEDGVVRSSMFVEGPDTLKALWVTMLGHIEERGRL